MAGKAAFEVEGLLKPEWDGFVVSGLLNGTTDGGDEWLVVFVMRLGKEAADELVVEDARAHTGFEVAKKAHELGKGAVAGGCFESQRRLVVIDEGAGDEAVLSVIFTNSEDFIARVHHVRGPPGFVQAGSLHDARGAGVLEIGPDGKTEREGKNPQ